MKHEKRRSSGGSESAKRKRLSNALGIVVATLSKRAWNANDDDATIRASLACSLEVISARGLVVYVASTNAHYGFCTPRSRQTRSQDERLLREIHERSRECLETLRSQHLVRFTARDGHRVLIARPPTQPGDSVGARPSYVALVFAEDSALLDLVVKEHRTSEFVSLITVFYQTLRRRWRMFRQFPTKLSEVYWEHSDIVRAPRTISPPWLTEGPKRTATLSLDLRKSTFCMEQADDPAGFAEWIEGVVRVLTQICHRYGGVMDKFTGDGVLAHFLDRECAEVYGSKAATAATSCAVDMLIAVEKQLGTLRRELLRNDSAVLGGGVGIDVADAHWFLGEDGQLLVVGRGLVGACRLGSAPAGRIRLSNIAFQELCRDKGTSSAATHARQILYSSKEFPEALQVLAWEFHELPHDLVT